MNTILKVTKKDIDNFFSADSIAVAGASRNEKSFSASVILHLKSKGYNIHQVNPNFTSNNLEKNEFITLSELPDFVKHLIVLTPPLQTASVIRDAIKKGITSIWIQQKSETSEAILLCQQAGIMLITNYCIFMFTEPVGIHKFHYRLKKYFGKLPA